MYTAYPENIETPYTPFALVNLRVYTEHNNFVAYIDIFNLSNKSFVELGNIEQPGRWISIGFKHTFYFPHD
jgi:iron complex outermembrane receptor protein